MTEPADPQGGAGNWSGGFLPPRHRGTKLRPAGSPVPDLAAPAHRPPGHRRRMLEESAWLNDAHDAHAAAAGDDPRRAARTAGYELAFRMRSAVPDAVDVGSETAETQSPYGLDDPVTAPFGRRCLFARRLVERGVRFVRIFSGGWDGHDDPKRDHAGRIASVDEPFAGPVRDLKRRGLLENPLVVWCGEFGRTVDNERRGGVYSLGRGHNTGAMPVPLAGGGVRPGVVGATDELGAEAVECVCPVRDFHVTLLHLLGPDDAKLTYVHAGRHKQLSQFGGEVIADLLA